MGRKFLGQGGPEFNTGPGEAIPQRDPGFRLVFVTAATLAVTDKYDGATFALNRAAGIAVTLPARPRVGFSCSFLFWVTATGNHTITSGDTDELYVGGLESVDTDSSDVTIRHRPDFSNDVIMTFNGTTTGGLRDTFVSVQYLAPVSAGFGRWYVRGTNNGSGAVATPFS